MDATGPPILVVQGAPGGRASGRGGDVIVLVAPGELLEHASFRRAWTLMCRGPGGGVGDPARYTLDVLLKTECLSSREAPPCVVEWSLADRILTNEPILLKEWLLHLGRLRTSRRVEPLDADGGIRLPAGWRHRAPAALLARWRVARRNPPDRPSQVDPPLRDFEKLVRERFGALRDELGRRFTLRWSWIEDDIQDVCGLLGEVGSGTVDSESTCVRDVPTRSDSGSRVVPVRFFDVQAFQRFSSQRHEWEARLGRKVRRAAELDSAGLQVWIVDLLLEVMRDEVVRDVTMYGQELVREIRTGWREGSSQDREDHNPHRIEPLVVVFTGASSPFAAARAHGIGADWVIFKRPAGHVGGHASYHPSGAVDLLFAIVWPLTAVSLVCNHLQDLQDGRVTDLDGWLRRLVLLRSRTFPEPVLPFLRCWLDGVRRLELLVGLHLQVRSDAGARRLRKQGPILELIEQLLEGACLKRAGRRCRG